MVSKILFLASIWDSLLLPYFYFRFNFSAGELIIKPLRKLEFLEQGIYNFYYFGFSDFHSQS